MQDFNTRTIREIALDAPQTTRVFEEFKIDYCCGGRKSLDEACRAAGVDPQIVSQKLETALAISHDFDFPEKKSASNLIDHIIEKHHVFTANELERLNPLMEKVCSRHGAHYPELFDLQKIFRELADDLTVHMRKEEMILFPFIKSLERSIAENMSILPPHFVTVKNPVRMMMLEHDTAGDLLRKMREITSDYHAPADACPSFKALYFGFHELEKDLHKHIHLENNVLFPQALMMEDKAFRSDAKTAFVAGQSET